MGLHTKKYMATDPLVIFKDFVTFFMFANARTNFC